MEEPQLRHKIGLVALNRDPNTPLITAFLREAELLVSKKVDDEMPKIASQ